MRVVGWTLIGVFGGAWTALAVVWLIRFLSGGFERQEGWVSLAAVGVGGAIAAFAVGLGALLVYRSRRQEFPKVGDGSE